MSVKERVSLHKQMKEIIELMNKLEGSNKLSEAVNNMLLTLFGDCLNLMLIIETKNERIQYLEKILKKKGA